MDIPLQFHEFRHLKHAERCPKYTELLQAVESIQPNDLDALYTDLETLQGASNIRLRRLEEEMKILTEWCDKKDRNKGETVDLEFLNTVSASKRSRTGANDDVKLSKKQKLEDSSKGGNSKKRSKGKAANDIDADLPVSKPKLTYDAPNKFWGYVEPYCVDITADDIITLEESLMNKVDISDYFKIPPLGRHYSEVWSKEDFIEEQQQGLKIDKKRSTPTSNVDNLDSKFSKIDTNNPPVDTEDYCPYGTFTQRLVAALVDENIMAPMTDAEMPGVRVDDDSTSKTEMRGGGKKSNMAPSTSRSLETAIKEELLSLGLIDSMNEEEGDFDADDEILIELRKCQSELKALRSHNKHSVNKLINRAKVALKKQEVRQKAKVFDAELVDIFRRFSSSKAKKKGLSRKDREVAWKTLREREAAWKMVDSTTDNEKNQERD